MYKTVILLVSVCVLHGYHFDEFQNNRWENSEKRVDYDDGFTQHDSSRRNKLYKLVHDLVEYEKLKKRNYKQNDDGYEDESSRYFQNPFENHFRKDTTGDENDNVLQNTKETLIDKHEFRMPGVVPKQQDTYLCYAYKLPEQDSYITKFEPIAEQKTAHHMLVYGCEMPFVKNKPWECGEMQSVCKSENQDIKYAWGKNAPSLTVPKDVAFHVGGRSSIKYLVMEIHYMNVEKFKDGKTKDRSGLIFTLTNQKPKYFAGVHAMGASWPPIPANKKKFHVDMGCVYKSNVKVFPFRYRVHSHGLGTVITGYRVRDDKWTLIGRGDPQRPQAFYKVMSDISLESEDKLMARCTYNSTSRDKTTYFGMTHLDEMCNFYVMYFYDAEKYGDVERLSCHEVSKMSGMKYPIDSDVSLTEMERKNSLIMHALNYKEVPHWPLGGKSPGDVAQGKNIPLIGQIAGVDFAEDNKKVLLFHRGSLRWGANTFDFNNNLNKKLQKAPIPEDTLVWLEKETGKVMKSAGGNMFYVPHGITVDHENNIWVTDVGAHQVKKLAPDGKKVLLTLGEKFVNGNDDRHFCKPTDVAVATSGEFYVSDGYCNSRVLKFNSNGALLQEMNLKKIGIGEMVIVHSISLDEKNNRLYVADRENGRVIIFDAKSGRFLSLISGNIFRGPVYAVAFNPIHGGVLHALIGKSFGKPQDRELAILSYSVHLNKIIGQWKPKEGFHNTHDLAVSKDNKNLVATEIGPNKVWRFGTELSKAEKSRP